MRTIWKFTLGPEAQQVSMPAGARLLHVDVQPAAYEGDDLCVWALVDPEAPTVQRRLLVAGTGWPFEFDLPYVGSAVMRGEGLVWHVFDGGEVGS